GAWRCTLQRETLEASLRLCLDPLGLTQSSLWQLRFPKSREGWCGRRSFRKVGEDGVSLYPYDISENGKGVHTSTSPTFRKRLRGRHPRSGGLSSLGRRYPSAASLGLRPRHGGLTTSLRGVPPGSTRRRRREHQAEGQAIVGSLPGEGETRCAR